MRSILVMIILLVFSGAALAQDAAAIASARIMAMSALESVDISAEQLRLQKLRSDVAAARQSHIDASRAYWQSYLAGLLK